ncbi:PDR/VanB family oxidoreductase [Azohydromonas australica]|uniref:PDR/VanB family oxidoreductase n=1 Tax=Azohydromonas australica TaxID=364039 RepID=UPI000417BD05|nr:PDR/VanB family oxidoreductase [Azohydromonas australica]
MDRIAVRVRRIHNETDDVRVFELASSDGQPLPAFSPGAHIDVHLGDGLVRQYSLCNGPADADCYIIGVKREPSSRGGSSALHDLVQEGDMLQIGAPRNNFELRDTAGHYMLVAGGIGITPMLSMARHLLARGASFELHYFARSIAQTAFHKVLSAPAFAGRVDFHYALEADAVRSKLRKLLWERRANAHLYLCGPRPFMDTVQDVASATWPPDAVHLEYFSADANALAAPCASFVVRLARSGGDYVVPAEQSIVQALAQYGVAVDVSCEQGVCGTCLTGVLAGEPDHRDSFLTDDERRACDKLMPCVSRSRTDVLILDL